MKTKKLKPRGLKLKTRLLRVNLKTKIGKIELNTKKLGQNTINWKKTKNTKFQTYN